MASSAIDSALNTASDLGRKLVNRAQTVVGDDARALWNGANKVGREYAMDYDRLTGGQRSKKARKPDPRKYKGRSKGGR